MTHYYCKPLERIKLKSNISLDENIYFSFVREITNTFEAYQVFRPQFLHKLDRKQNIVPYEFSNLSEKIIYQIKSSSLREWETFDCYEWMQSYFSDHILVVEKPKIILYITCHYFIHIVADDMGIEKIQPIVKKYNFYLDKKISNNDTNKTIYAKPRKLSKQQVLKVLDKKQYDLLTQFFVLQESFLTSTKNCKHPYLEFLEKNACHFFITLWDHWIKDDKEFKKLIIEYFAHSYLLKTQNLLMQQRLLNEDRLLNFLIWLSLQSESYQVYLDNNDELTLCKISQQDIINNFYMGIRLGRGYSFYFPKIKILINAINEDYCMEIFTFGENKKIREKIQEMKLYALKHFNNH